MTVSKPTPTASVWMSGKYTHDNLKLECAVVKEQLSTLTETQITFVSSKTKLDLNEMVGNVLSVHVKMSDNDDNGRMFTGTCVSVETVASSRNVDELVAEVRPWFWMLTLTRNNRVFQEMSVIEIINDVIKDHGQTQFLKDETTGSFTKREYCVQYRESDFDFLSRLMEEEGIFYYFDHDDAFLKNETLVLCDSTTGLGDLGGNDQVEYWTTAGQSSANIQSMTDWTEAESVVRGKVSLSDYDFEVPSVDQMVAAQDKRGTHKHSEYEYYDLPGHHRKEQSLGKKFAEIRLAADSARHQQFNGLGTARYMGAGHAFSLFAHPTDAYNTDYLVVGAVHHLADPYDFSGARGQDRLEPLIEPEIGTHMDEYSFKINAIKKSEQFRAPLVTPWPEVPGVQTGVVVGPTGEEIWTDEHGRVKVHFRWDRVNDKKDTASCWIRVATGWSGNNWGLNYVPRIGQEVLIQFEDGDPDRPIVTGMLYNAETMPPYVDKSQPTRTGLMTRSSPKGGAKDFNALVFEDKAGSEYTHFQSQKDYQMVVKDSAQITVGDDGVNVDPGKQDAKAGSLLQTVKKDVTEIVEEGDKTETVESGNMKIDVQSGKIDIDAAKTINVTAGQSITMEANQKITLKVGSSKIEMTQTGITIDAPLMLTLKGGVQASLDGGAMTIVKGALVNIN